MVRQNGKRATDEIGVASLACPTNGLAPLYQAESIVVQSLLVSDWHTRLASIGHRSSAEATILDLFV